MIGVTIRDYGLTMPHEMKLSDVTFTAVHAAYNRIMGPDRNGQNIVGYFNADYELFAWSYMLDPVTDIGTVADGWPVNWALHAWDGWAPGMAQRHVITLVRPAVDGDL